MASSTGPSNSAPSTPSDLEDKFKSIKRDSSSFDPNLESSSDTTEKGMERIEMSPRSFSDPAVGAPAASNMTRSNSEWYKSSSSASSSGSKRNSRQSLKADIDDEEEKKMGHKKRYSGSNHANVHTECGRHSDDWLVGPIIDTVKDAVKAITGGKAK